MRDGKAAGRHHSIGQRHTRRHAQSANADRFAARRPQCRFEVGLAGNPGVSRAHRFAPAAEMFEICGAIAARTEAESLTQPKMPPWALIIFRTISWNSGKYDAQPSASPT